MHTSCWAFALPALVSTALTMLAEAISRHTRIPVFCNSSLSYAINATSYRVQHGAHGRSPTPEAP